MEVTSMCQRQEQHGGTSVKAGKNGYISGNNGEDGEGRQTGGGASGAAVAGDCNGQTSISGKGSSGTSYSGGTRRRYMQY